MDEQLARILVQEAHSAAPHEMCGFVMKDRDVWSYIPIQNCASDPERSFEMEAAGMLDVLQHNAHGVAGIYHSHPKGNKVPSEHDVDMMRLYAPYKFRFWIVTYNNVYEWELIDDQPYSIRRDGTAGISGMAYPLLAPPKTV